MLNVNFQSFKIDTEPTNLHSVRLQLSAIIFLSIFEFYINFNHNYYKLHENHINNGIKRV